MPPDCDCECRPCKHEPLDGPNLSSSGERTSRVSNPTFQIGSITDAVRFQKQLNDYCRRKFGERSDSLPRSFLWKLYVYNRTERSDGRLFAAILDLELTYLSMRRDVHDAAGIWNLQFAPPKTLPESIFDDADAFAAKLDILHAMGGLAVRCRAFWDKAMGILFLLYDESSYEMFSKADSRKAAFRKRAAGWPPLSTHLLDALGKVDVDDLAALSGLPDYAIEPPSRPPGGLVTPFHEHLVRIVDTLDKVRTAEVHGTGTLRKWSLAMLPLHESKDAWLVNHWNIANGFMQALRLTFLDHVEQSGTTSTGGSAQ